MRNFDLAPLYRATVGFDQIADLMDRVLSTEPAQTTYPPYNIEKTADDGYRISLAVAGFSDADLGVEVRENALVISAKKAAAAGHRQVPASRYRHPRLRTPFYAGRSCSRDRGCACRWYAAH